MRKFFSFMLITVVMALTSHAITVNNTAGQLSQSVTNHQLTQLTITGSMDARDFLFISNELNELTDIDLSQVTISAINSNKPLFSTFTDYRANEIPRTAFFGKKLTTVHLPSTLVGIGFAAFAGCDRLQSITLPASVARIDDYAFAGTGLTSVEVPATVASMGKGVFSRCEQLTSASIQSNILGDFCFLGDYNLSQVTIGPSVSYILRGAFNGCTALSSINIDPACRINRIDEEAFINSGLESIDIVNLGVGTIGDWAFAQTQLSSLQLPAGLTQLGEGALSHNPQLETVIINGAKKRSAPSFNAPSPRHSLETINDYTFADDGALDAGSLLREGVTHVGNYALYNVSHEMDTMRLPSTLSYLGDYAMAGMIGMTTLKTGAVNVPALGVNVWEGVDQPSIPLIAPSDESTQLYKGADQWMNFFFQGADYIVGDVNGDGFVNISDVTSLINYLLSGDETGINLLAADVSADGYVNITDVTELINYLLTGASAKSVHRINSTLVAQSALTEDKLALSGLTIAPGETRSLDIALNNQEHDYTAMQCEIVLPQGLRLVGANGLNRGEEHSFYTIRHEQEQNIYSLIGVSMDMATFNGNEGEVMTLTFAADEDFDASDASISLVNVTLVTKRSEMYLSSDIMAMVNNTSSVQNINADKQVAAVRYINVAGQESETPFKGINIVVTTYTDGTTSTTKVVK
ncbi:MAG: leucine-rich repeat protein [Muribaculaceae bacterium]|nr:leucine-rich repeat protein [Muribaculaceae bacterium]